MPAASRTLLERLQFSVLHSLDRVQLEAQAASQIQGRLSRPLERDRADERQRTASVNRVHHCRRRQVRFIQFCRLGD